MLGLIATSATTCLTVGSWSLPQQPDPQGLAHLLDDLLVRRRPDRASMRKLIITYSPIYL